MKVSTLFAAALLPFTQISAFAIPFDPSNFEGSVEVAGAGYYHKRHLEERELQKRAQANAVQGVRKGYTGDVRVLRRDFTEFKSLQNGRVLDLFLLALERMQGFSSGNPQSYYDIAGIHGLPYRGWNGETAGPNVNRNSGYCTHGSTLFPTWHRPYLALIEQEIFRNAEVIVQNTKHATAKAEFTKALQQLRLPYYDWARDGTMVKELTQANRVYGRLPDGRTNVSKKNYLASYSFKPNTYNVDFPPPWNSRPTTTRDPNASAIMGNQGSSLRQQVYQLLSSNNQWQTFSNRVATNQDNPGSIEGIHDGPHYWIGGDNGQMRSVGVSSFDPIFWLHHCNIDRIFAIWQAINPNTYVTGQVNGGGTYGVPPRTVENGSTDLKPFRGLSGDWWDSYSARDTSKFGYGYAEVPKWNYKNNPTGLRNYAISRVNALYRPGAASLSAKRKRDDLEITNSTIVGIDESIKNNRYLEWRIDVYADKSALGGTYTVKFFIGRPSRDPTEWALQPELVGDFVVWVHTEQVAPGIDPSLINNEISGTVPLNDALIRAFSKYGLTSLNDEDTAPFLEKKLRWRVMKGDGTVVRPKDVSGLKVVISKSLVTLPENIDTEFPTYGEWEHVTEIVRRIKNDVLPPPVAEDPSPTSVAEDPSPTPVAEDEESSEER